jgi:hypothetical protein
MPLGATAEATPSPTTPMPLGATEEDAYRLAAPHPAIAPRPTAPSPASPKPLGAAEEEANRPTTPPPIVPIPTNPRSAAPRPAAPHRPRSLPLKGHGRSVRSKGDEPCPTDGAGTCDEED